MHAFLATLMILAGEPLPAPPAGEDLARAEADVQDVFGADLAQARKPADKVAVARKMIETAAGSRPAAKYALLTQARELAIAAGDSGVGVRAVEELARSFQPSAVSGQQTARDAASWASEGHRLWNAAPDKRPPEKLRARLDAAECYLRAMEGLTGFQRAAVDKRLRELGWKASPIEFNFEKSTEGWIGIKDVTRLEVKAGHLDGSTEGTELFIIREGLSVGGDACPILCIRMAVSFGHRAQVFWTTHESPRWADDKYLDFAFEPDGKLREYRIPVGSHRLWAGQTITAVRFDVREGPRDARKEGSFQVDYIRGAAAASSTSHASSDQR